MLSFKSRSLSSLVGLAFEGQQLEGVLLQRSNGSFKVTQSFRANLTLDPLTNDAELVGREIRNHLEEAGIRERRCAVCVPLQWALTMQAKLPDIPDQDVPGFLQLEAERGFPYAPNDLAIATSRYQAPNGDKHASLVAIPKSHLNLLEKALRAARLKPVSFSLGVAALQEAYDEAHAGQLLLAVGDSCVELQVSAKGGVAALRALEGAFDTEGPVKRVDAELMAREIRITLGQLPRELRESVNRVKIFGSGEVAGLLVKEITPFARPMGLLVEAGTPPRVNGYDVQGANGTTDAGAIGLVTKHLSGNPPGFEFLPPRQSPLHQVMTRFSSAKVLYGCGAAGVIALLLGIAFGIQQFQLSAAESKWRTIKPRVTEVQGLQQLERKFRPWYDDSIRTLRILRGVTEAFPADGAVWARTLKISKDLSEIDCTGNANDSGALTRLQTQLRNNPRVGNVTMPNTTSSKLPIFFTLSFQWNEGGIQ